MANNLKTTLLLGALTGLLVYMGGIFGGNGGMMMALVMAGVMNFGAYWFSDRIVLALYGAKEIPEGEGRRVRDIVQRLTAKHNMPMPKLYLMPAEAMNAFATGRNPEHAAVAVTAGILRSLTDEELEGVLAHELSHVRHRDTLISAISATIAGAIEMTARMAGWAMLFSGGRRDDREDGNAAAGIFLMIVTPLIAMVINLAISRSREYLADEGAARMAGSPMGLVRALQKLDSSAKSLPMEAGPATSHMFIVNPLSGRSMLQLFSTHPPVEKRIERLMKGYSHI